MTPFTIVSTDNGYEVRVRCQRVFGPCSLVECQQFVHDETWSAHRAR